ncbi:hypothetical protein NDU88_006289 [Pleurodeles waltl]|uniref:Uncharacterized protein n=1 Tax=Pleurodeles waltl TaxID=8319 RepID=A0AAV7NRD1_PLEWA|nr:hypothetical protein NDU88_006289 [Pleurodeles waltl]
MARVGAASGAPPGRTLLGAAGNWLLVEGTRLLPGRRSTKAATRGEYPASGGDLPLTPVVAAACRPSPRPTPGARSLPSSDGTRPCWGHCALPVTGGDWQGRTTLAYHPARPVRSSITQAGSVRMSGA